MSKFKNKKALTLAVGAIMAGVSVIGVVAACAPTKAKPAKPTEKKVEQPQTGGTESTKQGSGSTTNGTKQDSENNTPSTPTDKGSNNGGTTNPTGGSTNTSPETTPKNDSGTSSENKDTNKPKDDMKQSDAPGADSDKTNKPKVGSGDGSTETDKTEKPNEGSSTEDVNKPKGETEDKNKEQGGSGSASGQNSNPDKQQNPPAGNNVESGSDDSGKAGNAPANPSEGEPTDPKKMQDPATPPSGSEGTINPQVKPITVSLDEKQKLSEKNGDFVLEFSFANANEKYLEVELKEDKESTSNTVVKSKAKVKVTDNKATLIFSDIDLYSKYKINNIKAYDKEDSNEGSEVNFENLKNREITVDTRVLTPVKFTRDQYGLPVITLQTSENIYKKYIEDKKFNFDIENNIDIGDGSTQWIKLKNDLDKQIWTQQIDKKNNKVTFNIFTDFKYEDKGGQFGNWYISNLWESTHNNKNNLLREKIIFKK